ncbi:MAG: ribosomal subunit interface protein [Betaproteobacteria bacterium]|nr:ribosomal subunit interface protein [Betaproteobacteria bacterium]
MLHERIPNVEKLVEVDRVHRLCYSDPDIFDLEIKNIFEKTWQYCGHESQIPKAGDYWTFQIGRQPMVMVRGEPTKASKEGEITVLYNRCPHRGVQVCGSRHGHSPDGLTCPYHSWHYHHDGTLESVPLEKGYRETGFSKDDPAFHMKKAASSDSYRGFIFAKLSPEGPSLLEWMGEAKVAIDDMCDRSPVGKVEVVFPCNRVVQRSNWKFFMENQIDAVHPSSTHKSTGQAAAEVERKIVRETGETPLHYHMLSAFTTPFDKWDLLETIGYPYGHTVLTGYMGLRPTDADTLEHEAMMEKAYGAKKKEEFLSRNIHHCLLYPGVSIQSPLQQLRVLRPQAANRTLSEIWHFRLVGAPEAIYRRALWYFNLVNSPATMVNADDLENWQRGQWGLSSDGGDWVSFHRDYGRDKDDGSVIRSTNGCSEAPMRAQFRAWRKFMTAEK